MSKELKTFSMNRNFRNSSTQQALLFGVCFSLVILSSFPVYADGPAAPTDVTAFITKRDLCDHFRGEDPYDAERLAYIKKMTEENCVGTDQALANLRQKYASAPGVIEKLSSYEEQIEPHAR